MEIKIEQAWILDCHPQFGYQWQFHMIARRKPIERLINNTIVKEDMIVIRSISPVGERTEDEIDFQAFSKEEVVKAEKQAAEALLYNLKLELCDKLID